MLGLGSEMGKTGDDDTCYVEKDVGSVRAEIDTSATFESVKEAVSRFGGSGFWKPSQSKLSEAEHDKDEVNIAKLEKQAMHLENELIIKERETLEVLKELEATKRIVEDLKLKLQGKAVKVGVAQDTRRDDVNKTGANAADKENHGYLDSEGRNVQSCPSLPGLILMELKQAKLNLTRTTSDIADIRASVDSFNKKLEKDRTALEKTRERLAQNLSNISSLEKELNQTRLKLQVVKNAEAKGCFDNPLEISKELQQLSSEAEQFKKMEEVANSDILRKIAEIEQTKAKIKTTEIRLVAARKMKDAARAAEALALAEIKILSRHENPSGDFPQQHGSESVTLSSEEYSTLTLKAHEAEERSKKRVIDAMQQVDAANVSKMEMLNQAEEAAEELKTSKRELEVALSRVDAANKGKLAVEEALRKWRSEHGQKRRTVQNSTKFKNSCPAQYKRESRLLDVNGINMVSDGPTPVLRPTLSIGQILSRKLLLPEEFESGTLSEKSSIKRKVSLGQMLSKQNDDLSSSKKAEKDNGQKQSSGKRKKSGFVRFSLLLVKQSKKKKKPTVVKK